MLVEFLDVYLSQLFSYREYGIVSFSVRFVRALCSVFDIDYSVPSERILHTCVSTQLSYYVTALVLRPRCGCGADV